MIDEGVNADYIIENYLPQEALKPDLVGSDSEGELNYHNAMKVISKDPFGDTRLAKDLFRDLQDSPLDEQMLNLNEIFEHLPKNPNYVP